MFIGTKEERARNVPGFFLPEASLRISLKFFFSGNPY